MKVPSGCRTLDSSDGFTFWEQSQSDLLDLQQNPDLTPPTCPKPGRVLGLPLRAQNPSGRSWTSLAFTSRRTTGAQSAAAAAAHLRAGGRESHPPTQFGGFHVAPSAGVRDIPDREERQRAVTPPGNKGGAGLPASRLAAFSFVNQKSPCRLPPEAGERRAAKHAGSGSEEGVGPPLRWIPLG